MSSDRNTNSQHDDFIRDSEARDASGVLKGLGATISSNTIKLQVARTHPDAQLPSYGRIGDAGLDLYSVADVCLQPHQRTLIPTGIKLAIPPGYAGHVLPRSGHALKRGLTLVNAPGLIDSNYRGEIGIIAHNTDANHPINIAAGERIAQLVITPIPLVEVAETDAETLSETVRGEGGFGSSGA